MGRNVTSNGGRLVGASVNSDTVSVDFVTILLSTVTSMTWNSRPSELIPHLS